MNTKIRDFRKQLGLTQQELADMVDVARQTIIAIEQGRYNPSLGLAYRITRALKQRHIEDVFEMED